MSRITGVSLGFWSILGLYVTMYVSIILYNVLIVGFGGLKKLEQKKQ